MTKGMPKTVALHIQKLQHRLSVLRDRIEEGENGLDCELQMICDDVSMLEARVRELEASHAALTARVDRLAGME